MDLRWYRRSRMVVLNPSCTVLEAARAIEQNLIGAVIVQDNEGVVGIATDRDLAVRALGRKYDAVTTKIVEVMTPFPVTLTPNDGIEDAVRLMREWRIRRVPLVEQGRVVGIVTLDDLLLDEAASMDSLASVVAAQVETGGPAGAASSNGRNRRLARAEATLARWLSVVRDEADLDDSRQARVALDVVLRALVRRLLPGESKDLIAQLPSLLRRELTALPAGPDKAISEASIIAELCIELDLEPPDATRVLGAVAGVVAGSISEGQADDVRRQLPADLRDLFHDRAPFPLFI